MGTIADEGLEAGLVHIVFQLLRVLCVFVGAEAEGSLVTWHDELTRGALRVLAGLNHLAVSLLPEHELLDTRRSNHSPISKTIPKYYNSTRNRNTEEVEQMKLSSQPSIFTDQNGLNHRFLQLRLLLQFFQPINILFIDLSVVRFLVDSDLLPFVLLFLRFLPWLVRGLTRVEYLFNELLFLFHFQC